MKPSSWLAKASVAALLALLVLACSGSTLTEYCTGIPSGGCPGADVDQCKEDLTCTAIYAHSTSCEWSLIGKCPKHEPQKDATVDAPSDAGKDSGLPKARDAGFVLPDGAFGGPGCTDLEAPDCPLGLALSCASACCGCDTLYVCSEGGWNVWGECPDGGEPTPTSSP